MSKRKAFHPVNENGWLKEFRRELSAFQMVSPRTAFLDFIHLALDAFLSDHTAEHPREKHYMSIIKNYSKQDANRFGDMLGCIIGHMQETGSECLAELWEEYASSSELGQFFTPKHVCDLMAKITMGDEVEWGKYSRERPCWISDPSCGAGRCFTSVLEGVGKGRQDIIVFHGIDIDKTVCEVAALNMLFFNANSVILNGDTLGMNVWGGYMTHHSPFGGQISEITDAETLKNCMSMGLPLREANVEDMPTPETPVTRKMVQLELFA